MAAPLCSINGRGVPRCVATAHMPTDSANPLRASCRTPGSLPAHSTRSQAAIPKGPLPRRFRLATSHSMPYCLFQTPRPISDNTLNAAPRRVGYSSEGISGRRDRVDDRERDSGTPLAHTMRKSYFSQFFAIDPAHLDAAGLCAAAYEALQDDIIWCNHYGGRSIHASRRGSDWRARYAKHASRPSPRR